MRRVVVSLLLALLAAVADAEPPAAFPALALRDQFGAEQRVDETTRAVVFTRDMDAGDLVKAALSEDGAGQLARAGAVYVSDVSGMPRLVLRMMAKPAMKKRGYPILLDETGEATAALPAEPGKATWFRLDRLRVVETLALDSADAVREALRK
jgi:hypothetical protein